MRKSAEREFLEKGENAKNQNYPKIPPKEKKVRGETKREQNRASKSKSRTKRNQNTCEEARGECGEDKQGKRHGNKSWLCG